jgi:pyridoxamine 5'-phosphate oxidase
MRSTADCSPRTMAAAELRRADLAADPLEQFRRWFAEAAAAVEVPEAMALATAAADGSPSLRMVLLKGFDERGLAFFSHYTSRKGRELEANPRAALLLHWSPLGRQVRVEGRVEQLPEDESDAYFATRPHGAQLGALASRQSDPLEARAQLEERVVELEAELAGGTVPRPPTWGGYRVVPDAWEFWQHRDDRLHDRFRYERDLAGGWAITRLFP